MKTLVFVASHPDDEVLSSGALLINAKYFGFQVQIVWATQGKRSRSPHAAHRWNEAAQVAKSLEAGVQPLGLKEGKLQTSHLIPGIEDSLRLLNPNVVVWPFGVGPEQHQDHRELHTSMLNISKRWDYARCCWLVAQPPVFEDSAFLPNVYLAYDEGLMTEVLALKSLYLSEQRKHFMQSTSIRNRAGHWANQGRTESKYAEPYALVKGRPPDDLFPAFLVEYFQQVDGSIPVEAEINSLKDDDATLVLALIRRLQMKGSGVESEYRVPLQQPHIRCLSSPSERGNVCVLYYYEESSEHFVVLRVFKSTTSHIPPKEIQLAIMRKGECMAN